MKLFTSIFLCLLCSLAIATPFPIIETNQIFHPVYAQHTMVASQEEVASNIGMQILKQGGNAVDSAVAIDYALAVTLPKAGNLGGGGFMMIWLNQPKKMIVINYREKAPKLATENMFLDAQGNVDNDEATKSYRAVGVPGTVYGLNLALKKYGTLPLAKVMEPAINLAKNGIVVTHALSSSLDLEKNRLSENAESSKIFLNKDKQPLKPGDVFYQKDLANTLSLISKQGTEVFYKGEIAKKIVSEMQANKGLMTMSDLADYKAQEMQPLKGEYRGYKIYSVPPPSSGGVTLIELLNILQNFDFNKIPYGGAQYYHLLTEAMNYAFFDRNSELGDPDFVKNPIAKLISKDYAKSIADKIDLQTHTLSEKIQTAGTPVEANQNTQTTHFSVVDRDGNMVSNTYTLNYYFGNAKTVKGTGILLNNEMDDFTAKPGVPNSFGLIQGKQNAIAPGKRPLSSMTPTIILNPQGEPFMAIGTPGGSRIITQLFINVGWCNRLSSKHTDSSFYATFS